MRNLRKKIFALLLVGVMVLSSSMTAFAGTVTRTVYVGTVEVTENTSISSYSLAIDSKTKNSAKLESIEHKITVTYRASNRGYIQTNTSTLTYSATNTSALYTNINLDTLMELHGGSNNPYFSVLGLIEATITTTYKLDDGNYTVSTYTVQAN